MIRITQQVNRGPNKTTTAQKLLRYKDQLLRFSQAFTKILTVLLS